LHRWATCLPDQHIDRFRIAAGNGKGQQIAILAIGKAIHARIMRHNGCQQAGIARQHRAGIFNPPVEDCLGNRATRPAIGQISQSLITVRQNDCRTFSITSPILCDAASSAYQGKQHRRQSERVAIKRRASSVGQGC
jgi:hypothetical protein